MTLPGFWEQPTAVFHSASFIYGRIACLGTRCGQRQQLGARGFRKRTSLRKRRPMDERHTTGRQDVDAKNSPRVQYAFCRTTWVLNISDVALQLIGASAN